MNESAVKETFDILKRLTPKNQAYFMTLVRVAEIAENGAKNTLIDQSKQAPKADDSIVAGCVS